MIQPFTKTYIFLFISVLLSSLLPSSALALSSEELKSHIDAVTVRILERRCDPPQLPEAEPSCWDEPVGTGTIIARSFNMHYVLTARHVVDNMTDYKVLTSDQKLRATSANKVTILENDLAVVAFSDPKHYSVANLYKGCFSDGPIYREPTVDDDISLDSIFCQPNNALVDLPLVLVAGYPIDGEELKLTVGSFIDRNPTSLEAQVPYTRGYEFLYTNETDTGMSGGPIWDANGQLIGVHGQSEKEIFSGVPFGYSVGIPIDLFLGELNEIFSDAGFSVLPQDIELSTGELSPFAFSQEAINSFENGDSYRCLGGSNDVNQTIELTNQLYRTGQYVKALECIDQAIVLEPDSPSVLFAKGFLLMKMGRFSESLTFLTKIVQQDAAYSDEYIAWRWRGVVLNRMENYGGALDSFAQAAQMYRLRTGESYPQAWASIFSTLRNLTDFQQGSDIDWSVYSTWNSKGDKLYELSMHKLSLEAYRTAKQLGEDAEYSDIGILRSSLAINDQTPTFEILVNNGSISHLDPVWYYSYIFEPFVTAVRADYANDDLQRKLDPLLEEVMVGWGAEDPSIFSYAMNRLTDSYSLQAEFLQSLTSSDRDNRTESSLADVNLTQSMYGETSPEGLYGTYTLLYETIEELKAKGLYDQAFNLCSLGLIFHFDVLRYNTILIKNGQESIQPTVPTRMSCAHDFGSVSTGPSFVALEASGQSVLNIEVDITNRPTEESGSDSFGNLIRTWAEYIIRNNRR